MRKTALVVLLAGFSIGQIHAQTMEDAFLLSENNYEGTARTIALGNAVTALGGDLGAVTINPAASAVATYSQVTLTPGISIVNTTTHGQSPFADGSRPFFQNKMKTGQTDFFVPNFGFSVNLDTHRSRGVKKVAFGFTANVTNHWNEDTYASGINETTSYLGAMAAAATGYTPDELMSKNAFDFVPWNLAIGYYTGMIGHVGDNIYAGATKSVISKDTPDGQTVYDIQLAGPINQKFGRRIYGNKYDYTFNVGLNISDIVYVGANFGVTSASYSYSQYINESAVDPNDFKVEMEDDKGQITVSYFEAMKYKSSYALKSSGIYGKIGIIITPVAGLRIGAAIQTPTINWITENFEEAGESSFSGSGGGKYSETSPLGENRYKLSSPFRGNVGIAYTFGKVGLLSADYEFCNYGSMKYTDAEYSGREELNAVNQDINTVYGTAHHFRVGAEVKPIPSFAIRAGYGFSTSADKWDFDKMPLPTLFRHDISFGLGYSTKGTFFIDAAVKREIREDLTIKVYEDYIEDTVNFPSPSIRLKRAPWKAVLTLGWRF